MEKKENDKSLVMYTSLIFIVAIVMIIVSFFAQTHLDQSKITKDEEEKVSLSNKAAQVSEENMQLVELNKALKDSKTSLEEENITLKEENELTKKELENYKLLSTIAQKILSGNKSAARTLLKNIYTEDLTTSQKDYYDLLVKKSE